MDIFINERSFDGSAPPHAARQLLREFYDVLDVLRWRNYPDSQIFTHRGFRDYLITPQKSVAAWLSRQKSVLDDLPHGEPLEEDESDTPSLQPLVNVLFSALARAPDVEELIGAHQCDFMKIDHSGSMLAAAAGTSGVLTSLGRHLKSPEEKPTYPDGTLTVELMRADDTLVDINVQNFVTLAEARRCRRRYVPNPKHHPDRPHPGATRMPLDRAYDPFELGSSKERDLRDLRLDPPDTAVQRLLDQAIPYGNQLYNLTYTRDGKPDTFYKFMNDNMNGFHGFPISANDFPDEVMHQIQERLKKSA